MQQRVPWWGLVSAAAAPVLLIGGWTLAAARQPAGFDPVADTISALAALDAEDRWLMTGALAGLGLCHIATALALRPLAVPGRLLLGAGGVATLLVAAFPLPAAEGARLHTRPRPPRPSWRSRCGRPSRSREAARGPAPTRPVVGFAARPLLVGLLGWLGAELAADDGRVGLAERVTAGAQALWPLAAVLASRRRA